MRRLRGIPAGACESSLSALVLAHVFPACTSKSGAGMKVVTDQSLDGRRELLLEHLPGKEEEHVKANLCHRAQALRPGLRRLCLRLRAPAPTARRSTADRCPPGRIEAGSALRPAALSCGSAARVGGRVLAGVRCDAATGALYLTRPPSPGGRTPLAGTPPALSAGSGRTAQGARHPGARGLRQTLFSWPRPAVGEPSPLAAGRPAARGLRCGPARRR